MTGSNGNKQQAKSPRYVSAEHRAISDGQSSALGKEQSFGKHLIRLFPYFFPKIPLKIFIRIHDPTYFL